MEISSYELRRHLFALIKTEKDDNRVLEWLELYKSKIPGIVNLADVDGNTCLHHAVKRRSLKLMETLVETFGVDVNAKNKLQRTALHLAVRSFEERLQKMEGATDEIMHPIIHFLVKAGCDARAIDVYGTTVVHLTLEIGDQAGFWQMLFQDVDTEITDAEGRTALLVAAQRGLYTEIVELMRKKAKFRVQDIHKRNMFHYVLYSHNGSLQKCINGTGQANFSKEVFESMLNQPDDEGITPLHLAALEGFGFELLIEQGADITAKTNNGDTVAHYAAMSSNIELLRLLQSKGFDMDSMNEKTESPIMSAIKSRAHTAGEWLLENKCHINYLSTDHLTPLCLAVKCEDVKFTEMLLKHGAATGTRDSEGRWPVHIATERNNAALIEILGRAMGDTIMNCRDQNRKTAMHYAVEAGNYHILRLLYSIRPMVDDITAEGYTLMHSVARYSGDCRIANFLLEKQANMATIKDNNHDLPIHLAAFHGFDELLALLLRHSRQENMTNKLFRTPLACAVAGRNLKCVKVLLDDPLVQVDTFDRQSITPLFMACEEGLTEVTKLLLSHNADATSRASLGHPTYPGWNALDVAVEKGHLGCVKAIIDTDVWQQVLDNPTVQSDGKPDSPFRRMIRQLPEAAALVCDKGIVKQWTADSGLCIGYHFGIIVDTNVETHENVELVPEKSPISDDVERGAGVQKTADKTPERKSSGAGKDDRKPEEEDEEVKKDGGRKESGKKEPPKEDILQLMLDNGRVSLLQHELVNALLLYKWVRVVGFCCLNLLVYLLFLACYTAFMLQTKPTYLLTLEDAKLSNQPHSWQTDLCGPVQARGIKAYYGIIWVSKYAVMLLAIINLLKEFGQLIYDRWSYVTVENIVEVLMYSFALVVVIDFNQCMMSTGVRTWWQWWLGTVGLAFAWCNLVFFAQRFTALGVYVGVYSLIVSNLFKLICLFFPFLIAFTLGFHLLLANQVPFRGFRNSIANVLNMAAGEVNFGGTVYTQYEEGVGTTTEVYGTPIVISLFLVFVFLMSIAMSNMWVGIAVGDVNSMQKRAQIEALGNKVKMMASIENILPRVGQKMVIPSVYECRPDHPSGCMDRAFNYMSTGFPKVEQVLGIDQGEEEPETATKEHMDKRLANIDNAIAVIQSSLLMISTTLKGLKEHVENGPEARQ